MRCKPHNGVLEEVNTVKAQRKVSSETKIVIVYIYAEITQQNPYGESIFFFFKKKGGKWSGLEDGRLRQ